MIKQVMVIITFWRLYYITKTCPCNKQNFRGLKIENFQQKKFDIFLILAQNIDCGCKLELRRF